jgi:uncharacterized integral membrane protein
MQFLIIIALLIMLIAVVFALQNTAVVTITFLAWTIDGSLALVVLIAILTGVLISVFVSLPSIIKNQLTASNRKKSINELKNKIKRLEEKLAAKQQELDLYQPPPPLPLEPVQDDPLPPFETLPPASTPEE